MASFVVLSAFLLITPVLAQQAAISWTPNTESDLAGYVLYYKDDSNSLPLTKMQFTQKVLLAVNQTNYIKTGLSDGTHRFALTAFDTSSNESTLSAVVQKTVSSSPVTQKEDASGGGGGCGVVFPVSGDNSGDPPGPGDAAGMLMLFSAIFILFVKKTLEPLKTSS